MKLLDDKKKKGRQSLTKKLAQLIEAELAFSIGLDQCDWVGHASVLESGISTYALGVGIGTGIITR